MSDFQQDVIKIVLDKALLGLIAMAFGYYLSRLLERYRARKSYELFIWQQRVDACIRTAKLITEHHDSLMGLYETLHRLADKHPEPLTDEEAKPGYDYVESYKEFQRKLTSLSPLFPVELASVVIAYLDETSRVTDIVKGKFERGMPSEEELLMALARFHQACGAVIAAGPFETPKIESVEGTS